MRVAVKRAADRARVIDANVYAKSPFSAENLSQFRVHVLYKRPEIPAKKGVSAIAV
jgi:hypothetical protein